MTFLLENLKDAEPGDDCHACLSNGCTLDNVLTIVNACGAVFLNRSSRSWIFSVISCATCGWRAPCSAWASFARRGVSDKGTVGGAPFHIIIEGRCLLEAEDDVLTELAPGDLVVLPHGDRHALFSGRGAPRTPFKQVLEANGIDGTWRPGMRAEQLHQLRFGGHGALTRVITGVFSFRDRRRNPLLEALPTVIHVHGQMGRGPVWLEGSLSLLIEELMSGRPGFQTIAERVADMVFVQAVRDCIASMPTNGSGWLRGLTDPKVAQALSLVHARPREPWTVASLARAIGLSRTVFASRFRALVGSSVMQYVAARRMHIAAGMLADSRQALAEIASQVGYESEISFSRAFRRWAGVPPGQYRRRTGRSPASLDEKLAVRRPKLGDRARLRAISGERKLTEGRGVRGR